MAIVIRRRKEAVRFIQALSFCWKMLRVLIVEVDKRRKASSMLNKVRILCRYYVKSVACANPKRIFLNPPLTIR